MSNTEKMVEKNLIYKCIHGSTSYGLNTADSDIDIKGIFIPNKEYYYGTRTIEQQEYGPDCVIYALKKFIQLASDCNPNIIEVLFCDEKDILFINDFGKALRDFRTLFISKKAKHTFSGYAYAQLQRIKGHQKWINNPQVEPKKEDFFIVKKQDLGNGKFKEYEKFLENEYDLTYKKYCQYLDWKKNRNPKRAELEEKFGFDCYSSDTEFLTESGWKTFDTISNEKLATVNPKTFRLEYQVPLEKFDSFYNGNMYHLTGTHLDCLVTGNHKMFIQKEERKTKKQTNWNFQEACKLPDTFQIIRTISPKIRNFKQVHNLFGIDIRAYLRLMGWYVSEGSVAKRRKNKEASVLSISQLKGGKIHNNFSKLKNKYKSQIKINEYCYYRKQYDRYEMIWTIPHRELAKTFVNECGEYAKNKKLPRWIFNLSSRMMKILLNALIEGDGTKYRPDNSCIYYTSSKQLANDVQELAFLCGYETSLWGPYISKTQTGKTCDMYQIHINKTRTQTKRIIRNQNIKKLPVKNYRIVCFSVPNSILITRRNGKISIQGNCKHGMHLIRLLKMGKEILATGQVIVKRPDREELLAIRNGAWSYDKLIKEAEQMNLEIEELYGNSKLPNSPDKDLIDKLLIAITEEFLKSC